MRGCGINPNHTALENALLCFFVLNADPLFFTPFLSSVFLFSFFFNIFKKCMQSIGLREILARVILQYSTLLLSDLKAVLFKENILDGEITFS